MYTCQCVYDGVIVPLCTFAFVCAYANNTISISQSSVLGLFEYKISIRWLYWWFLTCNLSETLNYLFKAPSVTIHVPVLYRRWGHVCFFLV